MKPDTHAHKPMINIGWCANDQHCALTPQAKFLCCGRTAGTCIKEHLEEKEETSSEGKADTTTQEQSDSDKIEILSP